MMRVRGMVWKLAVDMMGTGIWKWAMLYIYRDDAFIEMAKGIYER